MKQESISIFALIPWWFIACSSLWWLHQRPSDLNESLKRFSIEDSHSMYKNFGSFIMRLFLIWPAKYWWIALPLNVLLVLIFHIY
jgi:hypothetical protein